MRGGDREVSCTSCYRTAQLNGLDGTVKSALFQTQNKVELVINPFIFNHTLHLETLFTLDLRSGSQSRAECVCVCLFKRGEVDDDSPVGRVCSHSRAELSAGRLSPLQSALVSYPVGGARGGGERQEVSQNISEMTGVHSVLQHISQHHNKLQPCRSCLLQN